MYNATKPHVPFKGTNVAEFQNKAILNSLLISKKNNKYSNNSINNIENILLRDNANKLAETITPQQDFLGLSDESNEDILYSVDLSHIDCTKRGNGIFGVKHPFVITDSCEISNPIIQNIINTRNNKNVSYICIWINDNDTIQLIKNNFGISVFKNINEIPNYKEAFPYLKFKNSNAVIMPKNNEKFDCGDIPIVPLHEFTLNNISHIKHSTTEVSYVKASMFQDKLDSYFKNIGFTQKLPFLIPLEEKLNPQDITVLLNVYVQNLASEKEVEDFKTYWEAA
jgi:hypothetical protein